jgi:hypothetical protein
LEGPLTKFPHSIHIFLSLKRKIKKNEFRTRTGRRNHPSVQLTHSMQRTYKIKKCKQNSIFFYLHAKFPRHNPKINMAAQSAILKLENYTDL